MDIVLSGLPRDRVLAYMDDISVYSPTLKEHLESSTSVFQKLRGGGITLKLAKCQFGCDSINFIGYFSPAREFAKNLNDNLQELYSQINMNLVLNRVDVKKQYDKNVRANNYAVGQKVW